MPFLSPFFYAKGRLAPASNFGHCFNRDPFAPLACWTMFFLTFAVGDGCRIDLAQRLYKSKNMEQQPVWALPYLKKTSRESFMRKAQVARTTGETDIKLMLELDGGGKCSVDTGFGFADHMLHLMAFWAGFDLDLTCRGDMHVDAHHTLEDVGICLGQAMLEAMGDRKGITRVGQAKVPMDEALGEVVLDLSGRPYLVYRELEPLPPVIAGQEKDLWREFFRAFSSGARINLHVLLHYGQNGHHMLESLFKSLGLALGAALTHSREGVTSTKGSLD